MSFAREILAGSPRAAGSVQPPAETGSVRPMLDLIAGGESGAAGYNSVYGTQGGTNLTNMTLNEVQELQRKRVAQGSPSSAVGRYQFIADTLAETAAELGLTGDERFDESLQDRLATHLLEKKGLSDYRAGKIGEEEFMANVAGTWAAVPKDRTGAGAYDNDGLNKANIAPDDMLSAIRQTKGQAKATASGPPSFARQILNDTHFAAQNDYRGSRAPFQSAYVPRAGTFARGVDRGIEQTQGLFGQVAKLVGDEFGFSGLAEVGDELIQESFIEAVTNPAEIQGLEDIRSGADVATFLAQNLGEQIPNLLLAAVSGGVGSYLGRAAIGKTVATNVAQRAAAQGITTAALKQQVLNKGAARGALAGVFAGFYPVNTGEIIQEQREAFESVENQVNRNPNRAIEEPSLFSAGLIGAASTAFETMGMGLIGKFFFRGVKQQVAEHSLRTVLKRVGHPTLKSLAAEGGTEAVQEALVIASRAAVDPQFSITEALSSSEGLGRMAFAGLAGASIGGMLGGAGGGVHVAVDGLRMARDRANIRGTLGGVRDSLRNMYNPDRRVEAEGEINSLGEIDQAGENVARQFDEVEAKIDEAVAAGDQEQVDVAVQEAVDFLQIIKDNELPAQQDAQALLKQQAKDIDGRLKAIKRRVNAMQTPEKGTNRTKSQDKATQQNNKLIKEALDALNSKAESTEQRAEQLINALEVIEKILTKTEGSGKPLNVNKKHLRELVTKAANIAASQTNQTVGKANKTVNETNRRTIKLNNKVNKVAEQVATPQQKAKPAPRQKAKPAPKKSTSKFKQTMSAAVDKVKKTGQAVKIEGQKWTKYPKKVAESVRKHGLELVKRGSEYYVEPKGGAEDGKPAATQTAKPAPQQESAPQQEAKPAPKKEASKKKSDVIERVTAAIKEAKKTGKRVLLKAKWKTWPKAIAASIEKQGGKLLKVGDQYFVVVKGGAEDGKPAPKKETKPAPSARQSEDAAMAEQAAALAAIEEAEQQEAEQQKAAAAKTAPKKSTPKESTASERYAEQVARAKEGRLATIQEPNAKKRTATMKQLAKENPDLIVELRGQMIRLRPRKAAPKKEAKKAENKAKLEDTKRRRDKQAVSEQNTYLGTYWLNLLESSFGVAAVEAVLKGTKHEEGFTTSDFKSDSNQITDLEKALGVKIKWSGEDRGIGYVDINIEITPTKKMSREEILQAVKNDISSFSEKDAATVATAAFNAPFTRAFNRIVPSKPQGRSGSIANFPINGVGPKKVMPAPKRAQKKQESGITFEQDTNSGYASRTRKNAAAADITIDFATTEKGSGGSNGLTQRATKDVGKAYVNIPVDKNGKFDVAAAVKKIKQAILSQRNAGANVSINIAGHGLSSLKGAEQASLDAAVESLLQQVHKETPIGSVRSGGQTGFDEAGAKAGQALSLPTTVLAPQHWKFRTADGQDHSNSIAAFKKRFAPTKQSTKREEPKEAKPEPKKTKSQALDELYGPTSKQKAKEEGKAEWDSRSNQPLQADTHTQLDMFPTTRTTVRVFDNEGNFLEETSVDWQKSDLDPEVLINATIRELSDKHGLHLLLGNRRDKVNPNANGFAQVSTTTLHSRMMDDSNHLHSMVYRAIWANKYRGKRKKRKKGQMDLPGMSGPMASSWKHLPGDTVVGVATRKKGRRATLNSVLNQVLGRSANELVTASEWHQARLEKGVAISSSSALDTGVTTIRVTHQPMVRNVRGETIPRRNRSDQEFVVNPVGEGQGSYILITKRMLEDAREDAEFILSNMMNLANIHADVMARPELTVSSEVQNTPTTFFAEMVDAAISGELGQEGSLLFDSLNEDPHRMYGVTVMKNGKLSNALVEAELNDEGVWVAVKTRKPIAMPQDGRPGELQTKLKRLAEGPAAKKLFSKLGRQSIVREDGAELANWELEVVRDDSGAMLVKQSLPSGVDNSIFIDQLMKIEKRGAETTQPGKEKYGVEATRPDGSKVTLHLGEITVLGRVMLTHSRVVYGDSLAEIHRNFMYGIYTLMQAGYDIPTFSAAALNVAQPGSKSGQRAALSKSYISSLRNKVRKSNEDVTEAERAAAKKELARLNPSLEKVIFGNITFGQSMANQKGFYALQNLVYQLTTDQDTRLAHERATLQALAADPKAFVPMPLDEALLALPLKELAEYAFDELKQQVARLTGTKGKWADAPVKRKRIGNKKTGIEVYYELGPYTAEFVPDGIVIRKSVKKKPFYEGAQVAFVPSNSVTQFLSEEELTMGAHSNAVLKKGKRTRLLNATTQEDALRQVIVRSVQDQQNVDLQDLSAVISLYGMTDHSLLTAFESFMADPLSTGQTETTQTQEEADTNEAVDPNATFGDPHDAAEAVANNAAYDEANPTFNPDVEEVGDFLDTLRERSKPFGEGVENTQPYKATIKPRPPMEEYDADPSRTLLPKVDKTNRTENVTSLITGWKGLAKRVQDLFSKYLPKLNEKVLIFDENNIADLQVYWQGIVDNKNITDKEVKALAREYLTFLERAKATNKGGLIYVPPARLATAKVKANLPASKRLVVIYLPKKYGGTEKTSNASRGWRLAHELGHLVQYVLFDSLDAKTKTQFRKEFGEDNFVEVFANWIAADIARTDRKLVGKDTTTTKVYDQLLSIVEAVFNWAVKHFGPPVANRPIVGVPQKNFDRARAFHSFVTAVGLYNSQTDAQLEQTLSPSGERYKMSALTVALLESMQGQRPGMFIRPRKTEGTVDAFTLPSAENVAQRARESIFQNYFEDFQNLVDRFKNNPKDAVWSILGTADAELRAMGLDEIADDFRPRAGSTTNKRGLFTLMRMYMAPHLKGTTARKGLNEILKSLPKDKETMQALTEAVLKHKPLTEVPAELRATVKDIRAHLDYLLFWHNHMTRTKKLQKRKHFFPLMVDLDQVSKRHEEFERLAVQSGQYTAAEAESVRQAVLRDPTGGLANSLEDNERLDTFLGPGMASKNQRSFDSQFRDLLIDAGFYRQDVGTTLTAYTEMLTRRVTWEKKFALTEQERGDFRTLDLYERYQVNPHSPIAKLHLAIARANLGEWQRQRVMKDILPAYAGQLGLAVNPHLRKIGAWMVIYQNIRLLSMAVFSSFVDMGTMMLRAAPDGNLRNEVWSPSTKAAWNLVLDKASREQAMEMLEAIGAMRQHMTEHVLNDQALNTFMTGRAKWLNDQFFHWNQMERWTNMVRAMALASAREFIKRNARKADGGDTRAERYLAELGLTTREAVEWDGVSTENLQIANALNRYIDEAMIRPDPAIRPVYMSDPGYTVFSHLKGFMYGFHETFLRRALRDAYVNRNLMPLLLLGMMALPFAAVGYEVRKKVSGSKTDLDGMDYLLEVIERSGMPGAFQMVVDMEQANEFGKPFLVGLGGPSVEHIYDLLTKDMDTILPRSLPVVAQSPALREWMFN